MMLSRRSITYAFVAVLVAFAPALTGARAVAAAPSLNLAGSWILVECDNISPDGTRVHLYGDDPQGLLILQQDGRYAMQIVRRDRPKFAAGDKAKGTPDEYRAAVLGYNAHYGRYKFDLEAQTVEFVIERANFPNWEGRPSRPNPAELKDDTLTYRVDAPTTGGPGVVSEVIWRRLK
jgi:Lipocalin-like domain